MVHGPYLPPGEAREDVATTVLRERLVLLLGVYDRAKSLIADWNLRAASVPDEVMVAVANHYREVCRDLSGRMDALWSAAQGSRLDLTDLSAARKHLQLIEAIDPASIASAMQEVRDGRVVTLEQMRRELRNKAR